MSIGQNIKNLRKEKDWTQQELAEATGIKVAHISKLESDEGDPKLSTLLKLTKALECSPNDLLWNEEISGLSLMLKNYAERCGTLPADDKATLLKIMSKYLQANAFSEAKYTNIPAEFIEMAVEAEQANEGIHEQKINEMVKNESQKEKEKTVETILTSRGYEKKLSK